MFKKVIEYYGGGTVFCVIVVTSLIIGVLIGMLVAHTIIAPDTVELATVERESLDAYETDTPPLVEPATPKYQEIPVTATAYCPCEKCCGKTDGITATGTRATAGRTIAVDPTVIPYGTEVIINGNTYVAEDCGGAIKENRIDVYFDTHEEALQFGRQKINVKIVRA